MPQGEKIPVALEAAQLKDAYGGAIMALVNITTSQLGRSLETSLDVLTSKRKLQIAEAFTNVLFRTH